MKYWQFKIYYKTEATEWSRSEWITIPETVLVSMPVYNSRTICAVAWSMAVDKFTTESTQKIELIATRVEVRG